MFRAFVPVIVVAVAAGCGQTKSSKVSNPVVGPPPPRIDGATQIADAGLAGEARHSSDRGDLTSNPITTASLEGPRDAVFATAIPDSTIVATVNGAPIFASEVLGPFQVRLSQLQQQLPPQEYANVRKSLLARGLPGHIERKLLVESMKESLEAEQLEMLDEQLDLMFEKEDVPRLLKQFGVNTKHELDIELAKGGQSLENIKTGLSNQRLAMEYLGKKSQSAADITRQELLTYYQEHVEDYAVPAKVRWQQIMIGFSTNGGKSGAMKALNSAVSELKNQVDFGEVVRRYSDGPTAKTGGVWDWTGIGSLAEKDVERHLFELPVNQISQVIEGNSSFQLVRVLERQDAGYTPFEKLQDDIESMIKRQRRAEATTAVMRDMIKTAVIWTIFDNQQPHAAPTAS